MTGPGNPAARSARPPPATWAFVGAVLVVVGSCLAGVGQIEAGIAFQNEISCLTHLEACPAAQYGSANQTATSLLLIGLGLVTLGAGAVLSLGGIIVLWAKRDASARAPYAPAAGPPGGPPPPGALSPGPADPSPGPPLDGFSYTPPPGDLP